MKSESVVQSEIRAEAGRLGILLWRNNRGAMEEPVSGRIVRFGLGNDSPQVDRRLKSSDLIGLVTDIHGPSASGVFLAVECKAEGWKFPDTARGCTPDEWEASFIAAPGGISAERNRTLAQWRFLSIVHKAGGLAGFAQSVADFNRILTGELVLP